MTHHLTQRPAHRPVFIRMWRWVIGGMDILYGGIYLAGGTANSPAQLQLAALAPWQVWGGVYAVSGALLLTRRGDRVGAAVGGFGWVVYAAASGLSIAEGTALSSGSPVLLLGWAALHLLILYQIGAGVRVSVERGP